MTLEISTLLAAWIWPCTENVRGRSLVLEKALGGLLRMILHLSMQPLSSPCRYPILPFSRREVIAQLDLNLYPEDTFQLSKGLRCFFCVMVFPLSEFSFAVIPQKWSLALCFRLPFRDHCPIVVLGCIARYLIVSLLAFLLPDPS